MIGLFYFELNTIDILDLLSRVVNDIYLFMYTYIRFELSLAVIY